MTPHENRLSKTVLMRGHNIGFFLDLFDLELCPIAEFHETELVIWSHSGEGISCLIVK